MSFELFYASGGHGGPYASYDSAKFRAVAILRGSSSERSIQIRERTASGIGGYGNVIGRVYKVAEGIFHQKQNITEFFGE